MIDLSLLRRRSMKGAVSRRKASMACASRSYSIGAAKVRAKSSAEPRSRG